MDKLDNVPAPHDAPEGRQGPPVLASGALGARRSQGRSTDGRATRRTRCRRPRPRESAGPLDRLLPHKAELEQHLVARLGVLFALHYDLLLYDVTSVYFEGQAARNPLAQRGHSRDHRPDCKQVCLALVVTREGMPVGYELFAGNRTDVTTVEQIVAQMEARFGAAQRIWVMDRGMTSADNVHWLRETGRRYLVGTPKSELRKWAREVAAADDWRQVRDGVEAKQCPGPDGHEPFPLVRSGERREKERAMHDRFARRTEEGLARIGHRVEQAQRTLDVRGLGRQ